MLINSDKSFGQSKEYDLLFCGDYINVTSAVCLWLIDDRDNESSE